MAKFPFKKISPLSDHNKKAGNEGTLLLELLVSVFIFSTVSFSIVYLVLNSGAFIKKEINLTRAIFLAKEGQEASLSIKQGSWDALTDGTYGLATTSGSWLFSGAYDMTDIFKREISISTLSTTTKKVVSKVSWQEGSSNKEISFEQILSNWSSTVSSQGTTTYDIGDSANEIYKNGNNIHLVLDNPTKSYAIVDVSNPLNPQSLSSMNFNTSGIDVFVYNNYAYVALNANKVVVINVSNPQSPVQVATIVTSVRPNAVYVHNNYLYIGLNRSSYSLYLYNVSNPNAPQYYSRYFIGAPVNDIKVLEPYIYMAINNGMGFDFSTDNNYAYVGVDYVDHGFEVYTIPNIAKIKELVVNGRGRKVETDGSTVYLAVFEATNGLAKINVTTPSNPSLIANINIGGQGNGVAEEGNYIYMAVENRDGGLYISTK